jgi:FdhD protein
MSFSPFSFPCFQPRTFARGDEQIPSGVAELVEEMPLAISINGIAHAVMMVTPNHLDAFVVGLACSEGIIEDINDVRDIEIETTKLQANINSMAIDLIISPRRFAQYKQKQHAHVGATGCGICGVESLSQAIPTLPMLAPCAPIKTSILASLKSHLSTYQTLGNKTGAVHAALLIAPDGNPILCMEDIGRHNALDKVIGYALQQRLDLHDHSVLMTSRCSTELVQKAVRVGLSRLIHLASPSTLAVSLAQHYGLNLIHLPKQDVPRVFAASTQLKGTHHE